ncbi:MAG TPA: TIM barrel protein [Motilibacteraceae bacterium]|nr:TIM barrel protein [Motilibacteraceae bacterium]
MTSASDAVARHGRPAAALVPGLVSVTFRGLDVGSVLRLCRQHELGTVEWGGDVHVPAGDVERAGRVREATAAAGVVVSTYGSYLRCGEAGDGEVEAVVGTAAALGAPAIRVWAGRRGSSDATSEDRRTVAEGVAAVARSAAARGLSLVLEHHDGTLTDRTDSATALLEEVACAGAPAGSVALSWQPPVGFDDDAALATLDAHLPHLGTVHVFSWDAEGRRLPLAARSQLWTEVFARVAGTGRVHPVLLEFVRDDDPGALAEDAAVLHELVGGRA